MVEIRFAQPDDREFWYGLDRHLTEEELACKIKEMGAGYEGKRI